MLNEAKTVVSYKTQRKSQSVRGFWFTIVIMSVISLGLSIAAIQRVAEPETHEIPITTLEAVLSETATAAVRAVDPDIDSLLDEIFAPVFASIPDYADFHYSVLGQYVELTAAVRGRMSEGMNERLFDGLEDRLVAAADRLDEYYIEAYRRILKDEISDELTDAGVTVPLGDVTQSVLQDAEDRLLTTAPLAATAATIVGSGGVRALTVSMASRLAAKIMAKAAAQGAVRGGGVVAGAAGGAMLCSWSGPLAAACGVVGAGVAWVVTDAATVNIDEFLHRDEFEADLREIVEDYRAEVRSRLAGALEDRAAAVDAAMVESFTLRDLQLSE